MPSDDKRRKSEKLNPWDHFAKNGGGFSRFLLHSAFSFMISYLYAVGRRQVFNSISRDNEIADFALQKKVNLAWVSECGDGTAIRSCSGWPAAAEFSIFACKRRLHYAA